MLVQIDLNMYPERRRELLLFNDGVTALPQLRVNGVYVGDGETVQELEDFGELDDVLEVCHVVSSPSALQIGNLPCCLRRGHAKTM
jgi:glutaredoxin-related protein